MGGRFRPLNEDAAEASGDLQRAGFGFALTPLRQRWTLAGSTRLRRMYVDF
jgi:hypothetical protein